MVHFSGVGSVGAFLINRARPKVETAEPSAELVRATGKCAECHSRTQYALVHEYEMSLHARKGVNCLDCHQPASGQEKKDHHGFVISAKLTAVPLFHLQAICGQRSPVHDEDMVVRSFNWRKIAISLKMVLPAASKLRSGAYPTEQLDHRDFKGAFITISTARLEKSAMKRGTRKIDCR